MQAALVVAVMSVLVFAGIYMIGDPLAILASPEATELDREQIARALGLDRPVWEQYLRFVGSAFGGDFGKSFVFGQPAMKLVFERMPATLELAITATFMSVLIGVPLGLYAGLRHDSASARAIMAGSVLGFSLPNFWVGLMLIMIFAVQLGWLPASGSGSLAYAILPIITLGTGGAAIMARFTRSAMLEVLGQPYIRAASAKGVTWRDVVARHALPNAAIPTVTIVGFMVGSLVAGAVVVESVFAWPGIGRLLVSAVANRDLSVVQAILMVIATWMVLANLTVDLAYGWLDPRVRAAAAH